MDNKYLFIIVVFIFRSVHSKPEVSHITPSYGSAEGETSITIMGQEFPTSGSSSILTAVLENKLHSYKCLMTHDRVTPIRAICDTKPMPNADYKLVVMIDGERIQVCNKCGFKVTTDNTPTIAYMPEQGAPQGGLVTFVGKLYTALYNSATSNSAGEEDSAAFKRVNMGTSLCEISDPATDLPYNLWLAENNVDGNFTCRVRGKTVDSVNASFIVSKQYGRAKSAATLIQQSRVDKKLYNLQIYPEIVSVEPSNGSRAGGTHLRITMSHPYADLDMSGATRVTVGGNDCEIMGKPSLKVVECMTGRKPSTPSLFGGVGGLRQRWSMAANDTTHPLINLGIAKLYAVTSYTSETQDAQHEHAILYEETRVYQFGQRFFADGQVHFVERYTGCFIAPSSGEVEFFMRSDDQGLFFIGQTGDCDPDSVPTDSNMITDHNPQGRVPLLQCSKYCPKATSKSVQLEKDKVYYIEGILHQGGIGGYGFEVGFKVDETRFLHSTTENSLQEIQELEIETNITRETYTLTIASANSVAFTWGGVTSGSIPVWEEGQAAPAAKVATAIRGELLDIRCSAAVNRSSWWENGRRTAKFYWGAEDYEPNYSNKYFGVPNNTDSAFCGRSCRCQSSHIYFHNLYRYPTMKDQILLTSTRYLCFAYKGELASKMGFSYWRTWRNNRWHGTHKVLDVDIGIPTHDWQYVCINMFDIISGQHQGDGIADYQLGYVSLRGQSARSWWCTDDIYIGNLPIAYNEVYAARTLSPFHSQEFFSLPEVELQSELTERPVVYKVTFIQNHCMDNLPNLVVSGGEITRLEQASIGAGGTFDLTYDNITLSGFSVETTSQQMIDRLSTHPSLGFIDVQRTKNCYGHLWRVTMLTLPGNQPQITADGSSLTGPSVTIEARTVQQGGFRFHIIPGDFLVQKYEKPQVVVYMNNIASNCTDDCSYEWTDVMTPQVTAINPSRGAAGVKLTITGSSFSPVASVTWQTLSVKIGGVVCPIDESSSNTEITCTIPVGPIGTHDLEVIIGGKGLAEHTSSGTSNFINTGSITSLEPSSGSQYGGTTLTIAGKGFTDKVTVLVDSVACSMSSINYTQLICTTPAQNPVTGSDTPVAVKVTYPQNDELTLDSSDRFSFSAAKTPIVSGISPTTSTVNGGGDLTVTGNNFGDSQPSGSWVKIGSAIAKVTSWTNTEIVVTLPSNTPGDHVMSLYKANQGFPNLSGVSAVTYDLVVTSVSPVSGSLVGGTRLTIAGRGFGDNLAKTKVTLGQHDCNIEDQSNTQITCMIERTSQTVHITNAGRHPEFGEGYAWSKNLIEIHTGDTVVWSWEAPVKGSGMVYALKQIQSPSARHRPILDFSSGAATEKGSFAHMFTVAGTYYITSGYVDPQGIVKMDGVVVVMEKESRSAEVIVKSHGYTVPHKKDDEKRRRRRRREEGDTCAGTTDALSGCTENPSASADDDSMRFYFLFSRCHTPSVTAALSSTAKDGPIVADARITVTGLGFTDTACQNELWVERSDGNASWSCPVTAMTSTGFTCSIDPSGDLPPLVLLDYSVRVSNLGYAAWAYETHDRLSRHYAFQRSVSGIQPAMGSVHGGTRITISGSGFLVNDKQPITVTFANYIVCTVASYTYAQVLCDVEQQANAVTVGDQSVVLKAGTQWTITTECPGGCYKFSSAATPTVTGTLVDGDAATPIAGDSTVITLQGTGFPTTKEQVTAKVGSSTCDISSLTDTSITCSPSLVVPQSGGVSVSVHVTGKGYAAVSATPTVVTAQLTASLTTGSTQGGQVLVLTGGGFSTDDTSVTLDDNPCEVQGDITIGRVECITPMRDSRKSSEQETVATLKLTSKGVRFPSVEYTYREVDTPILTSVTPTTGAQGQTVTITGSKFTDTDSDMSVTFAGKDCIVTSATTTEVQCTLPAISSSQHLVKVVVAGKGLAYNDGNVHVTCILNIASVSPSLGSYGGGQLITVTGQGFIAKATTITLCDRPCHIQDSPVLTPTAVVCKTTPYPKSESDNSQSCDVVVNVLDVSATGTALYSYSSTLTPIVTAISQHRLGTGGGVSLTITGTLFNTIQSDMSILAVGVACPVDSSTETQIVCTTAASNITRDGILEVLVHGKGTAMAQLGVLDVSYVDVWSSTLTWGGKPIPTNGDFVIVPAGQTVLLDVDTPVLDMLVIQGGVIIFDTEGASAITLKSEHILITSGGALQIGTEDEPYPCDHKATIEMHGSTVSKELPLFGAKTLAVRNGTLDMHGCVKTPTWTHLQETASAGTTQITLTERVNWLVGEKIVLPTTSHRHSQGENEVNWITAVSEDGQTLTLAESLKYEHTSIVETFNGQDVAMRGEVGLLTRNIVFLGSADPTQNVEIDACPEGFSTGQFRTQTCFQGRFGEEIGSDEFGGQIMFNSPQPGDGAAVGRLSYFEMNYVGQAFRLARYPLHFHLMGVNKESYIKGCAIHKGFNRAINIHGTHNMVIEDCVAYDIMGGAFFLEDGIETGNTFKNNLVVFVKASSSLLNDDITPAAYWVTNPNNTYIGNVAAGGTHFGFWYRLHGHPDGPSYDPNICPRKVPMGLFKDNTVHSQGWFGVWIFQVWKPTVTGKCGDSTPTPAVFQRLLVYNCEKGLEWVVTSDIQLTESWLIRNEVAGVEGKLLPTTVPFQSGGPKISNTLIVANSKGEKCTGHAIILPFGQGLVVDNVQFLNFDDGCCALGYTTIPGACMYNCAGYETRFSGITWVNSPRKACFRWKHEGVLTDIDGTLTGSGDSDYRVMPTMNTLPTDKCTTITAFSFGAPASLCEPSIRFTRFSFNEVQPASANGKDLIVTNSKGVSATGPWASHRMTHKNGWMVILATKESYDISFRDGEGITNISYTFEHSGFLKGDWVILRHNQARGPDIVKVYANPRELSNNELSYQNNIDGDIFYDEYSNKVSYLVSDMVLDDSSKRISTLEPGAVGIHTGKFQAQTCYFKDCVRPEETADRELLTERPANYIFYSTMNNKPSNGGDWTIAKDEYIVVDTALPNLKRLTIKGNLELANETFSGNVLDHTLTAEFILILGGRLICGWPEYPYTGSAEIIISGKKMTQEPDLWYTTDNTAANGPELSKLVIGVFGHLQLIGDNSHTPTWTELSATADVGATQINVSVAVNWEVGDEIAIASTTYDSNQMEMRSISSLSQDRMSLTLNKALTYKHLGETYNVTDSNRTYHLTAEVTHLTRNIKIRGDSPGVDDSYGPRTIISIVTIGDITYSGSVQLQNVEFVHCGQEGYTASYDPRFPLTLINLGESRMDRPVNIDSCSFNDNYSPAIGVFGSNNVTISKNVVVGTVGDGIVVEASNSHLLQNVVMGCKWAGSYNGRKENGNDYNSAFNLEFANKVELKGNRGAGSERMTYRIPYRPCINTDDGYWMDNVAHSSLIGVSVLPEGVAKGATCLYIPNFTVWRAWDFGIYVQDTAGVLIRGATLIDNTCSVNCFVIGPSPLLHIPVQDAPMVSRVENSLFVGTTEHFDYDVDTFARPFPHNIQTSANARCVAPRTFGAKVGLIFPGYLSKFNGATRKPLEMTMSYNSIPGHNVIKNVVFDRFSDHTPDINAPNTTFHDVALTTDPVLGDANHPVTLIQLSFTSAVEVNNKLYLHEPDVKMINPSDCVDMDCDGHKQVVIETDASFNGVAGYQVAESAFEWEGDPQRGLGFYRIPKKALVTYAVNEDTASTVFSKQGIYGSKDTASCTWKPEWRSFSCDQTYTYKMLTFESLDADSDTRRLSPIALVNPPYVDLVNGPQDHGWCAGYTCQKRVSSFMAVVALTETYEMYFTSTNPQKLRLQLLNAQASEFVIVAVYDTAPQKINVYANGRIVRPNNYVVETDQLRLGTSSDIPTGSQIAGSNYYDRDSFLLYVLVKGPGYVDMEKQPVIIIRFDMPPVSEQDFYKDENLISNLAIFLGISPSRIKMVNAIAASKRRKRASNGNEPVEIVLEITHETKEYQSNNNTKAEAEREELGQIFEKIVSTQQLGKMGEAMSSENFTVQAPVSAAVQEPLVSPAGKAWETQAGYMAEQEESGEQQQLQAISTPTSLSLNQSGVAQQESAPFSQPIMIKMLDAQDEVVQLLGSTAKPWRLQATLREGSDNRARLQGDSLVSFVRGMATFDTLAISHAGNGYYIDLDVTEPAEVSGRFNYSVGPFTLRALNLTANASLVPAVVEIEQAFSVSVDILDAQRLHRPYDITWKGHSWTCVVSLTMDSNYKGGLESSSNTLTRPIPADGRVTFPDLKLSARGNARLSFAVRSTDGDAATTDFTFDVTSEPIAVAYRGYNTRRDDRIVSKKLYMRFKGVQLTDYEDSEKWSKLEAACANKLSDMANTTVTEFNFTQGSIIVVFTVEGERADVTILSDTLKLAVGIGLNIIVDGTTLNSDQTYAIDGSGSGSGSGSTIVPVKYKPTSVDVTPKSNVAPKSNGLLSTGVIIAIVTVLGLLVVLVVILAVYISVIKPRGEGKTTQLVVVANPPEGHQLHYNAYPASPTPSKNRVSPF